MSGLDDLIAVVTAVAALLAGRAAYVGHRARRRLAVAVAGRTNGHASGRIPGTNPDVGGRDDPERRSNGSNPGRHGGRTHGRTGHDPSRLGGTAPDERDPDRYRVGRVDDTSEAHRPRPDGDAGGHERAERRDGRRHDGWSTASWLDAATAGGGREAAASDDDHPTDGASSGGPPHRKNGSTSDGRRTDCPPLGGSPTGGFPTGDVAAGWRSPAGVAGIVLGACAVALVAGVGMVLAGLVVAAVGAVGRRARDRAAERNQRRAQLPLALDRLASALHGGASVPAALAAAGDTVPPPLGPELAALGREADGGRAVAEVLDDWADRRGDPGTRLAATALVLAGSIGASPARAAHGVATTLRERAHLADERRSLAGQARLSGLVLSVAPIGFTVLVGAADPGTRHFLLHTPPGWACLTVGLALDAAGAWWMSALTRGSDR